MDITDRLSPSECSKATRYSLRSWNIKKIPGEYTPRSPNIIIKLMNSTLFFADGKYTIVFALPAKLCNCHVCPPPPWQNPKINVTLAYTATASIALLHSCGKFIMWLSQSYNLIGAWKFFSAGQRILPFYQTHFLVGGGSWGQDQNMIQYYNM